jgi:hypothetical protein
LRSFTEDESIDEAADFSGWSPIEVRARATEVVQSAVLYAAHALLHRGFAYDDHQGHAWMTGVNGDISRFVESEACKARVAHLVSGYEDIGSRTSMLLGETPLYYFKDEQPTWWVSPTNTRWKFYPNNTSPTTSDGLAFWADVCASWCVRRFDDGSEFMEINFNEQYGTANWGRCACYEYRDPDATSAHANTASHAAPDDIRVRADKIRVLKNPDFDTPRGMSKSEF